MTVSLLMLAWISHIARLLQRRFDFTSLACFVTLLIWGFGEHCKLTPVGSGPKPRHQRHLCAFLAQKLHLVVAFWVIFVRRFVVTAGEWVQLYSRTTFVSGPVDWYCWLVLVSAEVGEPVSDSAWAPGDTDEVALAGGPGWGDLSDRRGGQWAPCWSVGCRDERFAPDTADHGRQVTVFCSSILFYIRWSCGRGGLPPLNLDLS